MAKVTKKTAVAPESDTPVNGSFVGGFRRNTSAKQKKLILAGIGASLVVLGVFVFVLYTQLYPSARPSQFDYDGMTDFYLMEPAEVPGNIEPILGISENDLRTKTLTERMLPTFDKSFGAAKALVMLKEPKKALEAMELAEGQISKAELFYSDQVDFHYVYAGVAMKNSDKSLAKEQIAKARRVLDDAKVDAETKKGQYRQLRYFEEEINL